MRELFNVIIHFCRHIIDNETWLVIDSKEVFILLVLMRHGAIKVIILLVIYNKKWLVISIAKRGEVSVIRYVV